MNGVADSCSSDEYSHSKKEHRSMSKSKSMSNEYVKMMKKRQGKMYGGRNRYQKRMMYKGGNGFDAET